MLFKRVKPLDQILATAEKKALVRQLGAIQLTMRGIGAIIGTGIFVLTAEAGQKAGPGMMVAVVIAAVVCALAALAYAELASMVPVSGSAYTYTYAVLGEALAWSVGWALVLEYAVAAGAVAVGWSGYVNGLLASAGSGLPDVLRTGPNDGGVFNLLAFLISLVITVLLVLGTSKSAWVNAVLVTIKIIALTAFVIVAVPAAKDVNFHPFLPAGWGTPMGGVGVLGAAASIFFAYVGFDAVSTAAEETKNPNRNIPIGLIGSLEVCTIFYLLVGYGAVGAHGSQPMMGANGVPLETGSPELAAAFFYVGKLAEISNTGSLFAFIMAAIGVLILRRTQPIRPRPFRTPLVWVICPLAVLGCLLLFVNLSQWTIEVFFGWAVI